VRDHPDELDRIRTVFNADIVGLAAPLVLAVQNHPELMAYLRQLPLKDLGARLEDTQLTPNSDHFPFVLSGVPALAVTTSPPGLGAGWWVHTTADTLDKLDLRALREAAGTAARILLRMAMNPDGLPRQRQTAGVVQQAIAEAGIEESLRIQGAWPF